MTSWPLLIDDDLIRRCLTTPSFRKALPALASVRWPSGKDCGCDVTAQQYAAITAARAILVRLPEAQRVRLKQLLGAKQVRVVARSSVGAAQSIVF